jgi:hypothetical protein
MAAMASPLSHRLEEAVTHVNIDRQPDAVKQFFKSLALTPEGSVVEMNGKPLARMLPAGSRDPEWTDAKNVRRLTLIDRDIAGTITSDETLELELLQEDLQRHVELVAPLPLEYIRQLHQQLLSKAGEAASPGTP